MLCYKSGGPVKAEKITKTLSFEDALRRVLQVSKDEMKRLQENPEAMEWVREKRGPKVKSLIQ